MKRNRVVISDDAEFNLPPLLITMSVKRQIPYYTTHGASIKELVKFLEDTVAIEQESASFLSANGNDSDITAFISEYQKVLLVIKKSKQNIVSLLSKAEGIELEYAQYERSEFGKIAIRF